MATSYGLPASGSYLRKGLKKIIDEHNLPPVVFHSLRHTSVTYKLKLNGGDIKAVQGDSGHSQVNMITDVYSHIIDEDRRKNLQIILGISCGTVYKLLELVELSIHIQIL